MEERSHESHIVRQTSLEAYDIVGHLGHKQKKVLAIIHKHSRFKDFLTDREIARELGFMDPNKVRPRRHELMKLGLIVEEGTKKCTVTGRTAITWKIAVDNQRLNVFFGEL